jgi:hypothetical protein
MLCWILIEMSTSVHNLTVIKIWKRSNAYHAAVDRSFNPSDDKVNKHCVAPSSYSRASSYCKSLHDRIKQDTDFDTDGGDVIWKWNSNSFIA